MRAASSDRWLALALAGAMIAFTAARVRAPSPLPSDAEPSRFSAGRAREQLRALVGDGRPHPTGSPAATQARERIIQQLRALGYQPQVHEAFACSAIHICGKVKDVWALRPGAQGEDGPVVMVSVHYDSVPAGPGASDDGVGVAAALEIARALALEPPSRNPVLFFINEGEELGLLGAEAFVAEHPLGRRVGAVVNMEARGTSGPSLMFETHDGNGPLISLYARSVEYPLTNSVYYEIYKSLPNDTDLTVYKRAGYAGINFAFLGGEFRYHTTKDDYAHADPDSLQHQGQNALAMVRALAAADLGALRGGDAVFFDVFAFGTARWPLAWMPALGFAALALLLLAAVMAVLHGHARPGQLLWGLLAAVAAVVATAAVAAASVFLLRAAQAAPYLFLAMPAPAKVAFWASALAVAILVGGAFLGRAGRAGLWLGGALLLAGLGAAASMLRPGLSYPLVVPSLVAGLVAIPWAARRSAALVPRWVWVPPLLVTATVWLPLAWLLYDGLGVNGLAGAAVMFGLALAPLSSLWGPPVESRTLFNAAALIWAAGMVAQVASPRYTEDNPRKLNLEYVLVAGEPKPTTRWVAIGWASDLPEPLASAGRFGAEPAERYPWPSLRKAFVADAPALPVTLPTFEVQRAAVADGKLRVEGRLASPRGALYAGLVLPGARLASVKVEGKSPPAQKSKNQVPRAFATGGWTNLMVITTGTEGARYELELNGTEPVQAYVWDVTFGLPPEGALLAAARPSNSAPFQVGDATTAIRPITLQAR